MMEPWLAGFLIGFFEIVAAVLILHKTMEWGWLGILLLILGLLLWDYAFDFYPRIPSDLSPFQNTAGRMGCFLGAASSCIWLDAPKGKKTHALLCVGNWVQFTMATTVFLIASIYTDPMFADASHTSKCIAIVIWILTALLLIPIIKNKIGVLYFVSEKKEDNHGCLPGLIACIAAIWLCWNGGSSGYAAAIYDLDMSDRSMDMLRALLVLSLFYGQKEHANE